MNKILDIEILFKKEFIFKVVQDLVLNNNRACVSTLNANIVVNAYRRKEYRDILKKNTFNICDGTILTRSLNLINKTDYSSYPGPDFFMDRIKDKKYKHAFLGSTQNVLKNLKSRLIKEDKSIENSMFLELPFLSVNDFNYQAIAADLNVESPDFIWVSLGAPKQEEFSSLLFEHINKGIIVSVGAAFDFYSENSDVSRAPLIFIKLNLEWLYRLYKQPKKTGSRLKDELLYMPIILFKEFIKKKK